MIEASHAEVITTAGCEHTLVRKECERVGIYQLADLLHAIAVADEFLRRMNIHTVVAGILQRRTSYTNVHLSRTSLTQHLHDLERCCSAYNRVIDKHNPLALDNGLYRRQFHLHALLAQRLSRKDEGASDILALDQAHFIWKATGLRISLSGAEARIRHSDDDVRIGWSLLEQDPSGLLSVIMHITSLNITVRTRKIHIFHSAHRMTFRL